MSMSYEQEVDRAVDTIVDLCIYHEGLCKECRAQQLCNSKQPKDLANSKD